MHARAVHCRILRQITEVFVICDRIGMVHNFLHFADIGISALRIQPRLDTLYDQMILLAQHDGKIAGLIQCQCVRCVGTDK
ncbi:unknown [Clostridium sp. CAG:448]|nr:unknown [Clostridium sp. CAG:448]